MMNLNEQIKEIQNKFDKVMAYSQDIVLEEIKTNSLFEDWYEAKKELIEEWGGISVELPNVSIPISLQNKIQKKRDIERLCYLVLGTDAQVFIENQDTEEFFNNRVSENYITEEGKKINKGAKISKSIKHFSTNKDIIDRVQTAISREIQDCKLTGTLVMSVNPLDFISSSENAHNWRSCHALDGEYRAGNLSYMLDKHTFICYLKSATEENQLPHFPKDVPWNSKKWRVLMFTRDDRKVFMAGKQYPFENNALLDALFDKVIAPVYSNEWSDWTGEYNGRKMMKDALGSLHFNDCLISSTYKPVIKYSKDLGEGEELEHNLYLSRNMMLIGEGLECICCGQMVSMSESMLCDECGDFLYCDCCGEPINADDMYTLNGDYLCESCFDEVACYCENCDTCVDTRCEDMYWDEETDMYYCEDCYNDLIECREAEKHESTEGEL